MFANDIEGPTTIVAHLQAAQAALAPALELAAAGDRLLLDSTLRTLAHHVAEASRKNALLRRRHHP